MKLTIWPLLALLATQLVPPPAHSFRGGQDVGNGGDAIVCRKSTDNFLNGTYALDYVLTLNRKDADPDLAVMPDFNSTLDRLSQLIQQKIPSLSSSFEEYRTSLFNESDFTKVRIWEPAPFGLIDIADARISTLIPLNCQSGGSAQLLQAAIRQHQIFSGTFGHIVYKYMPDVLNDLMKTDPTQASFLLVHEWLWDFSSNVDRNRRINRFLHSKRIETMSPDDVAQNLKGMGFSLPSEESEVFSAKSCTGPMLEIDDLKARFPKKSVIFKMGTIVASTRTRILQCPATALDCSKSWTDGASPSIFKNYDFFGAIGWRQGDYSTPVQIVSPSHLTSERTSYQIENSQILCEFVSAADHNLSCTIQYPQIGYVVTGVFDRVVVNGYLTDECLRIDHGHVDLVPTMTADGESDSVVEVQTSLLVRYRLWN